MDTDFEKKKLYDAIIHLISNLHVKQGTISQEEMFCLLSILDITMMGKPDSGLISMLKEWRKSSLEPESQEIIKATLLDIDFSDIGSYQRNIETIGELLMYNKKLRDK